MEKEEAIKKLVQIAKAIQPQIQATPEEHIKIQEAIDALEEKPNQPSQ